MTATNRGEPLTQENQEQQDPRNLRASILSFSDRIPYSIRRDGQEKTYVCPYVQEHADLGVFSSIKDQAKLEDWVQNAAKLDLTERYGAPQGMRVLDVITDLKTHEKIGADNGYVALEARIVCAPEQQVNNLVAIARESMKKS